MVAPLLGGAARTGSRLIGSASSSGLLKSSAAAGAGGFLAGSVFDPFAPDGDGGESTEEVIDTETILLVAVVAVGAYYVTNTE